MSRRFRLAVLAVALTIAVAGPASASDDAALDADIHRLELEWAHIKFDVPVAQQFDQFAALAKDAAAVKARYPGRPEVLIWQGIAVSEEAGVASIFSALGYAKEALALLQAADKIDPRALAAGAPTSLGVLYYRVPGFPIGFGDKQKARQLLEQAVTLAPDGMDANYFFGDFLFEEHDYTKAKAVLQHALALPPRPDRPLWDRNRRIVIKQLLDKIGPGQPRTGTRS